MSLCNPTVCSPQGSSVHGILQERILEWVAMPSSRESFWLRDRTCVSYISCIGKQVLYHQCHLRSPCHYAVSLNIYFSLIPELDSWGLFLSGDKIKTSAGLILQIYDHLRKHMRPCVSLKAPLLTSENH